MKRQKYEDSVQTVTNEISQVLMQVDQEEISALIDEILKAEKIFVIGIGRVFLSLQCFAKRLAHFGFDINIVGSVVETSISDKDLLLVGSGSGESRVPVDITKIAKEHYARIALITSVKDSTIKSTADVVVHLPAPVKTDLSYGIKSIQPMSTLFEQSLYILGDIICLMLQERTGQTHKDLKKRHANLE